MTWEKLEKTFTCGVLSQICFENDETHLIVFYGYFLLAY